MHDTLFKFIVHHLFIVEQEYKGKSSGVGNDPTTLTFGVSAAAKEHDRI